MVWVRERERWELSAKTKSLFTLLNLYSIFERAQLKSRHTWSSPCVQAPCRRGRGHGHRARPPPSRAHRERDGGAADPRVAGAGPAPIPGGGARCRGRGHGRLRGAGSAGGALPPEEPPRLRPNVRLPPGSSRRLLGALLRGAREATPRAAREPLRPRKSVHTAAQPR